MKKSSSITLGLLAAAAMMVTTGCSRRTEVRDCIDKDRRLVEPALCEQQEEMRRRPGYGGGYSPYIWHFGGSSGGRLGDMVVGGNPTPTPGVSTVTRGGFGTSMGATPHASSTGSAGS